MSGGGSCTINGGKFNESHHRARKRGPAAKPGARGCLGGSGDHPDHRAPAVAASQAHEAIAIGSGTNKQTVTAVIPCNTLVTYTVIGGGGGGGQGSTTFNGGNGDMITGSFKLDCACGSYKTVTLVAAGGGARGLRNNQSAPSPSFATGGAGFGKGGDSGDVSQGTQWTNEYSNPGLNNNYMYGGGGGGGSAILIGTAPVIVAGGGGGGGTTRVSDNLTNGGTSLSFTNEVPIGGAAAPGTINGQRGEAKVTGPSGDTPSIVNEEVIAPPGSGAVGATPGAGGVAGSSSFVQGTIIDNADLQSYTAPAAVLLAGNAGTAPSASGGNGGDGVRAVSVFHGPNTGRGVYTNQGSPGGGGGYAGGGSSALTQGASGTLISGTAGTSGSSVRRAIGSVSGGAGAGSYLTSSSVPCVTSLSATGPVAPPATAPLNAYGSGGAGSSSASPGTAGEPGYVKLSW